MSDQTLLRIENLTVHYGRIAAVQDISLEVNQGEVVSLIGPNGAGKTTTLATIMGLVHATSGTITYDGNSIAKTAPEKLVRQGVALVPEGRHIFATLSVAENLQLGLTPLNRRNGAEADIERVLERFPILKTYYNSSAAKLSGGEQQQLAIARALLSRPRLLLLDEPSLGLAPLMVDRVFDELEGLRLEGVTLLLVEQNAARAVEFADRTYILRTGTITLTGTRAELLARVDLSAAYLGI